MAYFFILAAVVLRLIPHMPNFVPIAAMALFGGVYLGKKEAIIVPIVAMFVADYFIGFYNPVIMIAVYGSFLAIGLMGIWLKKHKTATNILGASLIGSVGFFLVTNFAMWAAQSGFTQTLYPQTMQGLLDCYIMGLPFFRNTLLGDLFYVGALFGLMEVAIYVTNKYSLKKELHANAHRVANK